MDTTYLTRMEFIVAMREVKRLQEFLTETFGSKFTDYRLDDPDAPIKPAKKRRRKENPKVSASDQGSTAQEISVVHLDGFEATPIKTEEDDPLGGDLLPIVTSTQSFCQISPPLPLPLPPPALDIPPAPSTNVAGLLPTKVVSIKIVPLTDREVSKHKTKSPLQSSGNDFGKKGTKTDPPKNVAQTSSSKPLPVQKRVFPPFPDYVPPAPGTLHPRRFNRNTPVNPPVPQIPSQNGTANTAKNDLISPPTITDSPKSNPLPTDDPVPSTSKASVGGNARKLPSLRQSVRPPARLIANIGESESEEPIRCQRCYELVYPSQVEEHNKTHFPFVGTPQPKKLKTPPCPLDLTKPLICLICNVEFKDFSLYERHCNNDHPEGKPCPICKKNFGPKTSLRRHLNIHGNLKFTCDACGKSYNRSDNLQKHTKSHGDNEPDMFFCWYCNIAFSSRTGRDTHVVSIHERENEDNTADECTEQNEDTESPTSAEAVAGVRIELAGSDEVMDFEYEGDDDD